MSLECCPGHHQLKNVQDTLCNDGKIRTHIYHTCALFSEDDTLTVEQSCPYPAVICQWKVECQMLSEFMEKAQDEGLQMLTEYNIAKQRENVHDSVIP